MTAALWPLFGYRDSGQLRQLGCSFSFLPAHRNRVNFLHLAKPGRNLSHKTIAGNPLGSSTRGGCGSVKRDRDRPRQRSMMFQTQHSPETWTRGNMAGDQQLMCSDCAQSFTFSAEDQEFFRDRGYSAPKRCKACRQAKKNEQTGGGGYQRSASQGTSVICSGCGQQTTVPFDPSGDRPVYCRDCFQSRKTKTLGRDRRGSGRGR